MVNRLRALLLTGEDDDRMRARGKMDLPVLTKMPGAAAEPRKPGSRPLAR